MCDNAQNGAIGRTTIATDSGWFATAACRARMVDGETRRSEMSLGMVLLIVLVLVLLGVIPSWPHSRGWGYAPGGAVGLVLAVVLILLVTGNL